MSYSGSGKSGSAESDEYKFVPVTYDSESSTTAPPPASAGEEYKFVPVSYNYKEPDHVDETKSVKEGAIAVSKAAKAVSSSKAVTGGEYKFIPVTYGEQTPKAQPEVATLPPAQPPAQAPKAAPTVNGSQSDQTPTLRIQGGYETETRKNRRETAEGLRERASKEIANPKSRDAFIRATEKANDPLTDGPGQEDYLARANFIHQNQDEFGAANPTIGNPFNVKKWIARAKAKDETDDRVNLAREMMDERGYVAPQSQEEFAALKRDVANREEQVQYEADLKRRGIDPKKPRYTVNKYLIPSKKNAQNDPDWIPPLRPEGHAKVRAEGLGHDKVVKENLLYKNNVPNYREHLYGLVGSDAKARVEIDSLSDEALIKLMKDDARYTPPQSKEQIEKQVDDAKSAQKLLDPNYVNYITTKAPEGINTDGWSQYAKALYHDAQNIRTMVYQNGGRADESLLPELFGMVKEDSDRLKLEGPANWLQTIKEFFTDENRLASVTPILGQAKVIADVGTAMMSLERVKSGMGTADDLINIRNYMVASNVVERARTMGGKAWDQAAHSVAFALELKLSGGTSLIAKSAAKATEKGFKAAIKAALKSSLSKSLKGAFATAVTGPIALRTTASVVKRMSPPELGGEGMDFGDALVHGYADMVTEVFTERLGGIVFDPALAGFAKELKKNILKGAKAAGKEKFAQSVFQMWRQATGGKYSAMGKMLGSAQLNSTVSEWMEEEAGKAIRGLVGLEDYKMTTPEELATQMLGFMIPNMVKLPAVAINFKPTASGRADRQALALAKTKRDYYQNLEWEDENGEKRTGISEQQYAQKFVDSDEQEDLLTRRFLIKLAEKRVSMYEGEKWTDPQEVPGNPNMLVSAKPELVEIDGVKGSGQDVTIHRFQDKTTGNVVFEYQETGADGQEGDYFRHEGKGGFVVIPRDQSLLAKMPRVDLVAQQNAPAAAQEAVKESPPTAAEGAAKDASPTLPSAAASPSSPSAASVAPSGSPAVSPAPATQPTSSPKNPATFVDLMTSEVTSERDLYDRQSRWNYMMGLRNSPDQSLRDYANNIEATYTFDPQTGKMAPKQVSPAPAAPAPAVSDSQSIPTPQGTTSEAQPQGSPVSQPETSSQPDQGGNAEAAVEAPRGEPAAEAQAPAGTPAVEAPAKAKAQGKAKGTYQKGDRVTYEGKSGTVARITESKGKTFATVRFGSTSKVIPVDDTDLNHEKGTSDESVSTESKPDTGERVDGKTAEGQKEGQEKGQEGAVQSEGDADPDVKAQAFQGSAMTPRKSRVSRKSTIKLTAKSLHALANRIRGRFSKMAMSNFVIAEDEADLERLMGNTSLYQWWLKNEKPAGFYSGGTAGVGYFVASEFSSHERFLEVFAHEMIGHLGANNALSKKDKRFIFDYIKGQVKAGDKRALAVWVLSHHENYKYTSVDSEEEIDEVVANTFALMSTHHEGEFARKGFIGRIAAIIRSWIRSIAPSLSKGEVERLYHLAMTAEAAHHKAKTTGSVKDKDMARASQAWHGTPHEFDKFTTQKMGTGEGAQAYGWGMYFAGKKGVAEFYKDKLSGKMNHQVKGNPVTGLGSRKSSIAMLLFNLIDFSKKTYASDRRFHDEIDYYLSGAESDIRLLENKIYDLKQFEKEGKLGKPINPEKWGDLTFTKEDLVENTKKLEEAILHRDWIASLDFEDFKYEKKFGRLYEVDLKPTEDQYLLLDKSISGQSESVQKAMREIYELTPESVNGVKRKSIGGFTGKTFIDFIERSLRNGSKPLIGEFKRLYPDEKTGGSSDQMTSMILLGHGVRGNKYLDGSSRSKGDGAYNYVIFDDSDVEITARASHGRVNPQTKTKAFRDWFGDSKVVDAQGEPLVVYHGSNHSFFTFKKGKNVNFKNAQRALGYFFAKDADYASQYGSAVMPVYLSIKNPYHAPLSRIDEIEGASDRNARAFKKRLVDQGYDGIKFGSDGSTVEWVAFSPTQIKSATGNSGAFSKTDPDIRASHGRVKPKKATNADKAMADFFALRLWSPSKIKERYGGKKPDYLVGVDAYISAMKEKLLSGKITARDVAKASILTVGSQGADSRTVDMIVGKLRKSNKGKKSPFEIWLDTEDGQAFLKIGSEYNKSGNLSIRPEEAVAAWLLSPNGKTALDNLEKGEHKISDWVEVIEIRKAYGDNRLGNSGILKQNVHKKRNIFQSAEIASEINKAVNDNKDKSQAEMFSAVGNVLNLRGIGEAKTAFVKHLLGMDQDYTIDAVQMNVWVTGEGDIKKLGTKASDVLRRLKKFALGSKKKAKLVYDRLRNSNEKLRKELEKLGGTFSPHISHHMLWDKAKGLETTHKGMYDAMIRASHGRVNPQTKTKNFRKGMFKTVFGASTDEAIAADVIAWQLRNEQYGGFAKSGFELSDQYKELVKSGHIVENFDIRTIAGRPAVFINPDNMMVGKVKSDDNGEEILDGGGGIHFVSAGTNGDVWASSKQGTANGLAGYINDMIDEDVKRGGDGKIHILVSKGRLSKTLTSHTGAKGAMGVLVDLMHRELIPKQDFRSALSSAGKKYKIKADFSQSGVSIDKQIKENFFGVDDSTFDTRGYFVAHVINHLSKNSDILKGKTEESKERIKEIQDVLNSEKGTGRDIGFEKAGIVDALGALFSDKMTEGVPTSHVYATIQVQGKVKVEKTEGGHESYPWHIRDEKGRRPVLNIMDWSGYNISDVAVPLPGFGGLGNDRTGQARGSIKPKSEIANERGASLFDIDSSAYEILEGFQRDTILLVNSARKWLFRKDRGEKGFLSDREIRVVEEWAGVKNGVWIQRSVDKFNRGLTQYLMTGKTTKKTPAEVKGVLKKIKGWLVGIYQSITASGAKITLSAGVTEVFEKLVTRSYKTSKKANPDIRASHGRVDQTQTKNFRKWFKNSKVVDADGKPLVVYHGTTHNFNEFKSDKANIENDMGAGFYFSNEPDDVGNNYAGEGPDLTNRIEILSERLLDEMSQDPESFGLDMDAEVTSEMATAEARKRLSGGTPSVIPVYLSFQNPMVVGGYDETFLTLEEAYNEELDEYGEQTGTLADFLDALKRSSSRYDEVDIDKAISDVYEAAMDNGGIGAKELIEILKESEGLAYAVDYDAEGGLASAEIIRNAFEMAGYDGIIDHSVDEKFGTQKVIKGAYGKVNGKSMSGMNPDTVHYIAFKSTQIKSATGNSGAFDGTNPDIRASHGRVDQTQTKTPQFKKWSGNAPFVSRKSSDTYNFETGEPVVVEALHGTRNASLVSFDPAKRGAFTGAKSAKMAFFATSNADVAASYPDGLHEVNRSNAATMPGMMGVPTSLSYRLPQAEEELERANAASFDVVPSEDEKGWFEVRITEYDQYGSEYDYATSELYDSKGEANDAGQEALDELIEKAEKNVAKYEAAAEQERLDAMTGSGILPIFIKMKNPLVHDFSGGDYRDKPFSDLIQEAIDGGHDGVIMLDVDDAAIGSVKSTVYAVFEPTQIKSATGNSGAFDGTNPDIRASHGRPAGVFVKRKPNKHGHFIRQKGELSQPGHTSGQNVDFNAYRNILGLGDLPTPEVESQRVLYERVRNLSSDQLDDIIHSAALSGRMMDAYEMAAATLRLGQLREFYEEQITKGLTNIAAVTPVEQLDKDGNPIKKKFWRRKTAQPTLFQPDIDKNIEEAQAKFDFITAAVARSKTTVARALNMAKLTIARDYSIVSIINRATVLKGGKLTAKETSRLQNQAVEYQKKIDEITQLVKNLREAAVQNELDKQIKIAAEAEAKIRADIEEEFKKKLESATKERKQNAKKAKVKAVLDGLVGELKGLKDCFAKVTL